MTVPDRHHPDSAVDVIPRLDNGLDAAGRIRREGSLERIGPEFGDLVAATEQAIRQAWTPDRLHSIYLYGSVPRGTAVPGRSDLDVSIVLADHVTDDDRERAARLGAELATPAVSEVGITVDDLPFLLSADQRYDMAFHISCLCTPLWGPDLAADLPDQYPTRQLAHDIERGSEQAFVRLRTGLLQGADRPERLRQRVGRRIARLAFAAVLARWPGWTSDPFTMTAVLAAFYPDRVDEIERCVDLGWGRLSGRPPSTDADHEAALELIDRSAPWWLAEHERVTAAAV
ncbi:nucleotidyltransferase domain-containing protein [Microlunatus soli]|uniref:Nucleotidyltransferase domain-containing protein n=1 Tax=Microlunatus soli TaxID=630515 RepID=A0A1H1V562_9ACTN|nr:nucleotidyltransferase domain-containing protein [Microlunatus soli]SDS79887.1 Nucleotidyltransferase domain-containing protein [Microlunatus soli]